MLGIERGRAHCHAAYHDVFRSLAAADLAKAFGRLVEAAAPLGHVAIDGKRLRGSQHETSSGVHMLHAFSTRLQAVVGSLRVPPDSGEAVEALALIKALPLEGAAFTTARIAQAIRDQGGHSFLFVKANKPALEAEIAQRFGDHSPLTAGRPPRTA